MTGKGETTLRIKELFSIPEGKKVTEKAFGRVLLSSICSILLCMACLVSTTWAWYTVSIENRGNEIQIATVTANVSMLDTVNNVVATDTSGKYVLAAGTYTAQINLSNDATEPKSPVYVVISVSHGEETAYYYLTFENGGKDATQIFQVWGNSATVSFSVSWVKPVSATSVSGEAVVIGEAPNEPISESSTETTAPVTDPSTETTAPVTEPSTEATTIPTPDSFQEETEETLQITEPSEANQTETTDLSTETTQSNGETESET